MANNPQSSGGRALRPPLIGSMGSQNVGPAFQFRPMVPGQQGQFMSTSSASQQFHPVGQGILPGQGQPPQFSQLMQQLQTRPLQPGPTMPSSQVFQMPYFQQNMSYASGSQQFQQAGPPSNHGHGFGSPGVPISSSYTFAPSSYGQPQFTMSTASQFQPVSQNHTPVVPVTGQPWLPSGSQGVPVVTPMQPTGQQPSAPAGSVPEVNVPNSSQHTSSDWQEFEAGDGRRYYYYKITRQSYWEKPLELMTPLEGKITTAVYAHCEGGFSFSRYKVFSYPERADASTVWKEFTTAEGRKYYYNKSTKESKWTIPDELKLAREEAEKAANRGSNSEMVDALATPLSSTEQASTTVPSVSTTTSDVASSPVPVTPVVNAPLMAVSNNPVENSAAKTEVGISNLTASPAVVPGSMVTPVDLVNTTPTTGSENLATHEVGNSLEGASVQDIEEAKKGMAVAGKINVTPMEHKTVEDEPFVYASKQEAKHAFKALLESANVEADWNWEQAMRVIINDKRYGALKTLGERKQALNEYLMQRKKLEAEERRLRQREAKEEFTKMLEESKELTSSMRWSKAITIFEDDERFKAVERAADREDLFKNYLEDLQKKEKIMAQEELRQNRLNYRKFLETCGLIKVDTQWRKVQDRLEDDESGSRLEKIDRLEIFQDYIRDLEKEEDEQRKIKKEQMKRVERKNRDEFRKMMEEHVASGNFTAKTQWRDYCQKVKDSAPYQAVALNLSGSTPKDLFEDVAEELQRQYDEDKSHIKDAMKSGKISFSSTWTFEDFKAAIPEDIGSPPISDINLQDKVKALKEGINQKFNKLVFDDLLERIREKEEKEAKRRQRLVEDFSDKLSSIKEIIASSNWEESKQLFEGSSEYRSIREESAAREIFEEYVARLQEKAREKERKRDEEKAKKEREREEKEKRKEKDRREKEKEREREREKEKGTEQPKSNEGEVENLDVSDNYGRKEEKKREKDRERKHRKRHHSDAGSDKDEKEDSNKKSRRHGSEDEKEDFKKSRQHGSEDEKEDLKRSRQHGGEDEKEDLKKFRRHGSDRKKSRKHAYTPESDTESRHKRNKRDRRNGSSRNGGHEELEDGELGEDGEIR